MGISFTDQIPLLSDAIAFIGNERTNYKNLQAVRETNQTNMAIAQANNEAAAALQEKNNQFNAEQSELSYNRNRELSLELLRNNQLYNSARAQAMRYGQAGINPNVAFANGTTAVVNGSGASASSPASSAPLPQFQAPSLTPPVVSNPFQQINIASDLANFMKSIAEAKKAGAETTSIESQLKSTIEKIESETELNNAKQRQIEYTTAVDKLNLDARQKAEIKERLQHIQLMTLQGKTEEAEKELKDAQKEYQNIQSKTARDSLPLILKGLEEDNKLKVEQQNTEKAKQTANYASANASNASAAEARSRIKVNAETAKLVHEQAVAAHAENFALTQNKVENAMALTRKLEREGVQTDLLKELLEKARKDNSSYYYKLAVDLASQLIGDVTGLKGAFSK